MHLLFSRLPFAADAMLALAQMHAARGEPAAALNTLDKTLRMLGQLNMPLHIQIARQLQQSLGAYS
jgi:hypothetical protein